MFPNAPGVSKTLLPVGKQIRKTYLMIFIFFVLKNVKPNPFARYCLMSKWVLTKTIVAVFLRGSKERNPTMTTGTITARRKGYPQYYVEGKLDCWDFLFLLMCFGVLGVFCIIHVYFECFYENQCKCSAYMSTFEKNVCTCSKVSKNRNSVCIYIYIYI